MDQFRNAHTLLRDFNDELPLYNQTGGLIELLNAWRPPAGADLPAMMVHLGQAMADAQMWAQVWAATSFISCVTRARGIHMPWLRFARMSQCRRLLKSVMPLVFESTHLGCRMMVHLGQAMAEARMWAQVAATPCSSCSCGSCSLASVLMAEHELVFHVLHGRACAGVGCSTVMPTEFDSSSGALAHP